MHTHRGRRILRNRDDARASLVARKELEKTRLYNLACLQSELDGVIAEVERSVSMQDHNAARVWSDHASWLREEINKLV